VSEPITDPIFPANTDQQSPALITGNNEDDDPQVLDALFEQVANPPEFPVTDIVYPVTEKPFTPTKLLPFTMTASNTWGSVQVFPKDKNRLHLHVNVIVTGTDEVWLSDGSTGGARSASYLMNSVITSRTLDDFTGPLWVTIPSTNAANVTITAVAVTK
jgi:hypothetical protein